MGEDKNRKLLMLDWDLRARSRPEGETQRASLGQGAAMGKERGKDWGKHWRTPAYRSGG